MELRQCQASTIRRRVDSTYRSKNPFVRLFLNHVEPLYSEPIQNELDPIFMFWNGAITNEGNELVCGPSSLGFFRSDVSVLLL